MALEVEHIDGIEEANRNQWNHVVEGSELGCVFHRYEWLRAIEEGLDREPRHVLVSKKGNPIALLPNFVAPLGPVAQLKSIEPGYGGPIAMTDEERAIELLLDGVAERCDGRVLFNQLRTYDEGYVRYQNVLRERGYDVTVHSCRFALDLTRGWDAVFERMDGERRRGIRRGHETEFEVREEPLTAGVLAAFYDDYVRVMDRVGMRAVPYTFLAALENLEDRVVILSLRVDGRRRGMYLFLEDDEQSAVQHLYTAVTRDHFEYHAPELLHEHAIRRAIDRGYETYELRGSTPDFRNGVFGFKEHFGARPMPLLLWERGRPAPAQSALDLARTLYWRFGSPTWN
ncbi:peptidoglycan bridge formation glycyltransferase FemA/FemB family protein [Natronococcus occultus]|uniref:Putative methicillin resistance protein n=1 Tax=Natronococcus occultus SP4 TaxID=694430 RepID=L0K2M5_9EURY|nr:peptidoglycan bridge formation glycyltransferase FemA/FemB family protein [Natronococcus occultus]AGB39261.1 putative methicillin resistance protein [Natronococcus occultus SP4]